VDAARANRIRDLVQRPIDWQFLMRKSFAHGVMPLLYKNLNAICPQAMPRLVADQLRDCFRAHAERNLFLTAELLRLLRLLADRGIAALPYKGPVLAASIYGDISLRSFSDLDILVNKQDILSAKDLLLAEGYGERTPLTSGQEQARIRSRNQKDFALVGQKGLVKVELHWEVASLALFPLETEQIWERLESLPLGGAAVLNLHPEDLLLILCVHGAKHSFKRLEWVCDIAELLTASPSIRWNETVERATELHAKKMLFLGLLLARDLLGTRLPEGLSGEIEAHSAAILLADQFRDSIFDEIDLGSELFMGKWHRTSLVDNLRDRMRLRIYNWADYTRVLMKHNEIDREFLRLPPFLSFLYHLLRPIRLVKVYGPPVWAHFLRQVKHRVSGFFDRIG
jgi:hypothetical protein